ncbi:hypothetical protein [Streptomyces sp. NBC_00038]|uniref:hypothetical protein n=1 Tax=Streptomyces sp. NBC_00038 TaxID=2903615 RepID=UPI002252A1A0|nr:hypothetical protein [Streptomyces sp. NBC_00038]MCX5560412.1 hypothetical protein [Streptomyces sp. NBC_00038]
MNERGYLESVEQFALYLSELQSSLDPESYALLLHILKVTNEAVVHRNADFEILMSDREQELFTAEFGEALSRLLGLLGPMGIRTLVDLGAHAGTTRGVSSADGRPTTGPDALTRLENDRREIEGIARASGMEP